MSTRTRQKGQRWFDPAPVTAGAAGEVFDPNAALMWASSVEGAADRAIVRTVNDNIAAYLDYLDSIDETRDEALSQLLR